MLKKYQRSENLGISDDMTRRRGKKWLSKKIRYTRIYNKSRQI